MSTESTQHTLRDRQTQQVRDEIRHQFINLVLRHGFEGFTMQDIAAAAGVSVRTLYRYFPSREAFAEDLRERALRAQQDIANKRGPADWTENPDFLATTFQSFESVSDFVKVSRLMRASGIDPGGARDRTEALRARLESDDDVHPEAVSQLTGVLRLLGSTDAWLRLTEEDIGLDSRSAGHAVQWAMEVLMAAVRDVEGPLRPEGKATR